jgi:hypothetical protein
MQVIAPMFREDILLKIAAEFCGGLGVKSPPLAEAA